MLGRDKRPFPPEWGGLPQFESRACVAGNGQRRIGLSHSDSHQQDPSNEARGAGNEQGSRSKGRHDDPVSLCGGVADGGRTVPHGITGAEPAVLCGE